MHYTKGVHSLIIMKKIESLIDNSLSKNFFLFKSSPNNNKM